VSKPTLNVVELPGVSLNDLPGQLRALADAIESGEQEGDTAYVVIPTNGTPDLIGIGRVDDPNNSPMIQLGLALHSLYAVVAG
jgi:hypothetical protein